MEEAQQDYQLLSETLEQFHPMNFTIHWVRGYLALGIFEIAVKKKLDDLGLPVEGKRFEELYNTLEQALQEKEDRKIRKLLVSEKHLRDWRNTLFHEGHLIEEVEKEDADLIVRRVSGFIKQIF